MSVQVAEADAAKPALKPIPGPSTPVLALGASRARLDLGRPYSILVRDIHARPPRADGIQEGRDQFLLVFPRRLVSHLIVADTRFGA
jgi:hypothetical protein